MVYHVLYRGVGRRTLFEKDQDFLAFERVLEETLRIWERRLDRQDREAVGNRVDVTRAGEAEETAGRRHMTLRLRTLPKGPKFGGWLLLSPGGWHLLSP